MDKMIVPSVPAPRIVFQTGNEHLAGNLESLTQSPVKIVSATYGDSPKESVKKRSWKVNVSSGFDAGLYGRSLVTSLFYNPNDFDTLMDALHVRNTGALVSLPVLAWQILGDTGKGYVGLSEPNYARPPIEIIKMPLINKGDISILQGLIPLSPELIPRGKNPKYSIYQKPKETHEYIVHSDPKEEWNRVEKMPRRRWAFNPDSPFFEY
jgi:hypothetical protein